MTADLAGNVYATGSAYDGSQFWAVVRESTDGGTTWNTVDKYLLYTPTGAGTGLGMCTDLLGNVYYAANQLDSTGVYHWIVRKSTDHGATWSTVNDFQYVVGFNSLPQMMYVDQLGNIYNCGQANDASGNLHWIVRKSPDNGATWSTVDDFLMSGGTLSYATGVSADTSGNIYVTGGATGIVAHPELAGIGGNGGVGGDIYLLNLTTGVGTNVVGSAGTAGSNPVSGIGGVGGAGGLDQSNL
jgi:hypothetical protein